MCRSIQVVLITVTWDEKEGISKHQHAERCERVSSNRYPSVVKGVHDMVQGLPQLLDVPEDPTGIDYDHLG